ncbi:MAG: hypothetical protein CME20_25750 [Gemmatimonadetes bacterium]|nr:hypothetical protein [Gemmatimonadota bacterium]
MGIELFPGKHLFVDDLCIEELIAARRVLNRPQKHPDNPVLRCAAPWDAHAMHLGKVLYDAEREQFRLWYTASTETVVGTRVLVRDNPPRKVRETHICYAESVDAVHWQRPDVGIAEQERYPGNNIVIAATRSPGTAELSDLIEDLGEEDPDRRFKMMYMDQAAAGGAGDGLAPDQKRRLHAHSPDGIHWTRYPWASEHVARLFGVLAYLDEVPSGSVDPDAPYILYGQRGSRWKTRQIGRRDSRDFINWSSNRPVLESSLDHTPGSEFYHLQGAIINQTYGGLYLGMLGAYYADLRRKFDPARNDGLTECQLAYSRDTMRWARWDEPFIARGDRGAFDWGGVYCGYPVVSGAQIYFMYTGNSERHGVPSGTAFGLATMRLDGFVSVEAEGFMEGILVTRPHHWHAAEVRVNVHALHGGLKVQLQDEMGHAFAGFGDADCQPICADAIDEVVTWKGGDVRSLQGRMVALKFTFCPEDKLYSYTLTPSGTA